MHDQDQSWLIMLSQATNQLVVSKKYKHGTLFKKSQILKVWKKRSVLLNYLQKTLSLRSGISKKEKQVQITHFNLAWLGPTKDKKKFALSLTAKNKKDKTLKYKRIILSDSNESLVRDWFNEIQLCMENEVVF